MMTALAMLVFGGAFALSMYAITATIVPAADQIRAALAGDVQRNFAPLAELVLAERRIAVRRWAATPARAYVEMREAA